MAQRLGHLVWDQGVESSNLSTPTNILFMSHGQRKTIIVYFDHPDEMGYPFQEPNYVLTYQGFSALCNKNNVDFFIARTPESYLGHMQFRSGWRFVGDRLERVDSPLTADVIYYKGNHLEEEPDAVVVNRRGLRTTCDNKLNTYALLSQYMATTRSLAPEHWQQDIQAIPGDLLVVKPVRGTEGRGIVIKPRAEFNYADLDQTKAPFLVQEFVDCSAGIPGLMQGKHDLRLIIFNGQVKLAEYRQPKEGGYLANVAQGGSLTFVPMDRVPDWAMAFVGEVDQHLTQYFPRIYAIDLMYANDRPYLVELNSQPGLPYPEWPFYNELHGYIFETLMSALR